MKDKCPGRKGYEFTFDQKQRARTEASGQCQFPGFECPQPANNRVGHFTGISDGKSRGVIKEAITSDDNRIIQCNEHDLYLDNLQRERLEDQKAGFDQPPMEVIVWISPN